MCDRQHTGHSDKLFAISQNNTNSYLEQGVRDRQHTCHPDELFAMLQNKTNDLVEQDVCDIGKHANH